MWDWSRKMSTLLGSIAFLSKTGSSTSLRGQEPHVHLHVCPRTGPCICPQQTHPRDFFFAAGTISASMLTLRSNFRVKHSLLGSWGEAAAAHPGVPPARPGPCRCPAERPGERGWCLTSVCLRRAFFLGSFSAELLRSLRAQGRQGDGNAAGWGSRGDARGRGLTLCYPPVPPPPPPRQRQGWCVGGTSASTCCGPGWSLQTGVELGCAGTPSPVPALAASHSQP